MSGAVIGIAAHSDKPETLAALSIAIDAVLSAGCRAVTLEYEGFSAARAQTLSEEELYKAADAVLVMGGDGSFLRAQGYAAPLGTPVLCAHFGRLGYLAEIGEDELAAGILRLAQGEYEVEERMMAVCETPHGKQCALNDIVLARGLEQGVLRYTINVDGAFMDRYAADGAVVATPTGATAYALSAGGPIVGEGLDCLVLCPIYPHTLRARATVLSPNAAVSLTLNTGEAHVLCDGRLIGTLSPNETLTVRRAPYAARFVRLKQRDFYAHLRSKLVEWSK